MVCFTLKQCAEDVYDVKDDILLVRTIVVSFGVFEWQILQQKILAQVCRINLQEIKIQCISNRKIYQYAYN